MKGNRRPESEGAEALEDGEQVSEVESSWSNRKPRRRKRRGECLRWEKVTGGEGRCRLGWKTEEGIVEAGVKRNIGYRRSNLRIWKRGRVGRGYRRTER